TRDSRSPSARSAAGTDASSLARAVAGRTTTSDARSSPRSPAFTSRSSSGARSPSDPPVGPPPSFSAPPSFGVAPGSHEGASPMKIAVPRETAPGERRVALTPEAAGALVKTNLELLVEAGAGEGAFHADAAFEKAGARIVSGAAALYGQADVVLKVQK